MGIDKKTGKDRQAKLYELTSQTSLPTMLHDEERPRNVWIEQLSLAEKIGSNDSPSLIPRDFKLSIDRLYKILLSGSPSLTINLFLITSSIVV